MLSKSFGGNSFETADISFFSYQGKEPVGFGFDAGFDVENVWQNGSAFLLKVTFAHNDGRFLTRSELDYHKKSADSTDSYPVYALIHQSSISGSADASGDSRKQRVQQQVRAFYIHNREEGSRANIKKSIISLTSSNPDHSQHNVKWDVSGNKTIKSFAWNNGGAGNAASILKPEIRNIWQQEALLDPDHGVVSSSTGWQNITLRSRIYTEAHSHMSLVYDVKLDIVKPSLTKSAMSQSIDEVIASLGEEFIEESGSFLLQQEKSVCHDCRSFAALTHDYEDYLRDEESASMQSPIAYLKILNGLRHEGPGTGKEDILTILNNYDADRRYDIIGSLMDILAGARTETTITAALEYLDLQNNDNLDVSERFLSVLPASYVTAANSLPNDWSPASGVRGKAFFDSSSHRFVMQELIRILDREGEWRSEKVRWSTFLSLAAITKSHNKHLRRHGQQESSVDNELSETVMQLIRKELSSCEEDECRIALMHALGNTGNLSGSIDILETYALDTKGRRESIAAMKAIKECLEESDNLNQTLITRLRNLSLMIVYDNKHETTSRIIATEIIAKHLSDSVSSERLLEFISDFGSFFLPVASLYFMI